MTSSVAKSFQRPRVVVFCQVSYGVGHWRRTAAILDSLRRPFEVTLVLGGIFAAELEVPEGIAVIQLPAKARDAEGNYTGVDTALSGKALDHERGRRLAELAREIRPAAVLIEFYPFGRVYNDPELTTFLTALREAQLPPIVLTSVRDIGQTRSLYKDWEQRLAADRVNGYFDGVLVHSDPRFASFDETFPVKRLRKPIHHTGFAVSPGGPKWQQPNEDERLIVVSVGGGNGGESLLRLALDAYQRDRLSREFRMLLILGVFQPPSVCRQVRAAAREIAGVEVVRWLPDLRSQLAQAAVSVSRAGYNTSFDLVRTGTPSLVLPYVTPTEDEQDNRASRLSRLGLVRVLAESAATPELLAREIRSTSAFRPTSADFDFGGAERTATLLMALIRERQDSMQRPTRSANHASRTRTR